MDEDRALTTTRVSTPEGRAASSRNARRHGLHTAAIVIPGVQTEEGRSALRDDVVVSLALRVHADETRRHTSSPSPRCGEGAGG